MSTPSRATDTPMEITLARRVMRNVKVEMARRDLVQKDLADILGVSQQAISDRVKNKTPLSLGDIEILAARFDMTAVELISGQRNSPEPDPMIMTDCSRLADARRYTLQPIRNTIRHRQEAA